MPYIKETNNVFNELSKDNPTGTSVGALAGLVGGVVATGAIAASAPVSAAIFAACAITGMITGANVEKGVKSVAEILPGKKSKR